MKKMSLMLSALVMLLGLAACDSTPKGVVGEAGEALENNDLAAFSRTLTGDALAKYGNAEGMQALRTELQGQEWFISSEQLMYKDRCGNRCTRRVYDIQVTAPTAAFVRNAEVVCRTIETVDPKTRATTYSTKCRISQFN